MPVRVAIVGAGVAGLACGALLAERGLTVTAFDKGRRPGGRLASRVEIAGGQAFSFDYGAQYFTARHPDFLRQVRQWAADGLVARWPVIGKDAWIGVPGMSALVVRMAAGIDVHWSHHVSSLVRRDGSWFVRHGAGEAGPFDWVVLALPAEQAAALAGVHDFALARLAAQSPSRPCWAAMLGFDAPLGDAPTVVTDSGPIQWAARNTAKTGRCGGEAWTVHADHRWSAEHLEREPEAIAALLAAALVDAVGARAAPLYARAHRWRYALSACGQRGAYGNPVLSLGACGDWLLAPRIESAWISGRILAEEIAMATLESSPALIPASRSRA